MSGHRLATRIFDAKAAQCELEDLLEEAGAEFERLGWDDYDCSVELYGVPDDHRLSEDAQKVIFDAGFLLAYVNHENKWETHYRFDPKAPFSPMEGWRVSYPHKRGDDGGKIWVEKIVESWPKDWFETGYVLVKDPSHD